MSEQIDLHWLACELDHDIKNNAEGLERIRWNNRAMMLMLQKVQGLLVACELADKCLANLMKEVPWGKTFDLDIESLNKSLIELPKAIANAKG